MKTFFHVCQIVVCFFLIGCVSEQKIHTYDSSPDMVIASQFKNVYVHLFPRHYIVENLTISYSVKKGQLLSETQDVPQTIKVDFLNEKGEQKSVTGETNLKENFRGEVFALISNDAQSGEPYLEIVSLQTPVRSLPQKFNLLVISEFEENTIQIKERESSNGLFCPPSSYPGGQSLHWHKCEMIHSIPRWFDFDVVTGNNVSKHYLAALSVLRLPENYRGDFVLQFHRNNGECQLRLFIGDWNTFAKYTSYDELTAELEKEYIRCPKIAIGFDSLIDDGSEGSCEAVIVGHVVNELLFPVYKDLCPPGKIL